MADRRPDYSFHSLLSSISGTAPPLTASSASNIPRASTAAATNRKEPRVKKEPPSSSGLSGLNIKPEPVDVVLSDSLVVGPAHSTSGPTVAKVPSNRAAGTPHNQNPSNPNNGMADGQGRLPFKKARENPVPRKLVYTVYHNEREILYTPEAVLSEGLAMANVLKAQLSKLHVGNKMRQDVWRKEIARMENTGIQDTMIALCGATGAGKSSVINSVLQDNIVPTSGMRACTATVTEIRYHDKRTIEADIEFLSRDEWKTELDVLIQDLQDENGDIKRLSDMRNDAGVAWHKVHAVYPHLTAEQIVRMSAEEIILSEGKTARALNTTRRLCCPNSKEFGKEIALYIDSKNQKRDKKKEDKDKKKKKDSEGPAYWPLIRQVKVYVKADALSTGAVLCDLPGCADANAARSNIAKDYMKRANCIWVLAPIHRAVDDKTAKDLLGDAFKTQLLMDGNYDDSTVTFIATKADDIAATEIIDALRLDDEPELLDIEDTLNRASRENKSAKVAKGQLTNDIEMMRKQQQHNRLVLKELEEHLHCVKVGKRFTPRLTAKTKRSKAENPKKRKSKGQGRKGNTKRRKHSEGEDENSDEVESDASASNSEVDSYAQSSEDESDELTSEEDQSSEDDEPRNKKSRKGSHSKKLKRGESEISRRPPTSDDDSGNSEDDDSDVSDPDNSENDSDIPKSKKALKGKGKGKRRSSDADHDSDAESADEESDEEETEDSLTAKVLSKKDEIKALQQKIRETKKEKDDVQSKLSESKKTLASTQKRKNAFCALKRAEYSRDVLKQDFRLGLRELDETVAIERDAVSFDPSQPLRDYAAIDLPVFCVSARDYARIHSMHKGDGDPSTFTNDEDTEIPALRNWCKTLTENSRERNARIFLESVSVFATSILSYVEGLEGISPADREALRLKWQTPPDSFSDDEDPDDPYAWIRRNWDDDDHMRLQKRARSPPRDARGNLIGILPRLRSQFDVVVEDTVDHLKDKFKEGLDDKCTEGALNAARSALEISDEFANGIHWQTYRATLRREGAFRQDLNELLCMPLTKNIAGSWAKIFETNLFSFVESRALQSIQRLLNEIEASTRNSGLKERCKMQGERALEEAKVDLGQLVAVVGQLLQSRQKDISRCIAPTVRAGLREGYMDAASERGTGSVFRQKALFRQFLSDVREDIFEGGTENIFNLLDNASEGIGEKMEESLEALAQKVEVNLAVLWEETNDSPEQRVARAETKVKMKEIINQVAYWRKADTLRS